MFRVAVVGGGHAGKLHLQALSSLPNTVIQALVEPVAEVREALGRTYAIGSLHERLETVLDRGEVDVVCLATPPAQHYAQANQVLAANLPLLLEKPICLELSEAQRLVEVGHNKTVLVGHNLRHHRLVAQARSLIKGLGKVLAVRSVSATAPPDDNGWKSGSEGRLLTELGTHHFDLMRDLLGLALEEATVQESQGSLAYQGRASGALVSSQFLYSSQAINRMEVDFEQGRLMLDFFRFDGLTCIRPGRSERINGLLNPFQQLPDFWRQSKPYGGDFLASYRNQWLHLFDCISRRLPCRASLEDGREALRWASLPLV